MTKSEGHLFVASGWQIVGGVIVGHCWSLLLLLCFCKLLLLLLLCFGSLLQLLLLCFGTLQSLLLIYSEGHLFVALAQRCCGVGAVLWLPAVGLSGAKFALPHPLGGPTPYNGCGKAIWGPFCPSGGALFWGVWTGILVVVEIPVQLGSMRTPTCPLLARGGASKLFCGPPQPAFSPVWWPGGIRLASE